MCQWNDILCKEPAAYQLCLHQADVSLSAVYKHHTVIQLVACSQTLFILFRDFQAQV